MIDAQDLSNEILAAVREVGNLHGIKPNHAADCIVLVKALGAVLLAVVTAADPEAMSVCASREDDGLDDGLDVVVSIHSGGEYFNVDEPQP